MNVEKMEFPKEEVILIVDQIIKLSTSYPSEKYNTEISETITILNQGLKLLVKPYMFLTNEQLTNDSNKGKMYFSKG